MVNAPKSVLTKEEFLRLLNAGLGFSFTVHHGKNRNDYLAELCDKYGSDKGELQPSGQPYPWPSHNYTDYYSRLFGHCRTAIKTVFECGLGTNNPQLASSMGINGRPGASLRVWRDYFPNAMIYGADIDRAILFEEDRIKTFFVDQCDPDAIRNLWSQVGPVSFDVMVDDGLHAFHAGSTLFTHSIDQLAEHGIYIIEDVSNSDLFLYKQFFSKLDYVVEFVNFFRPNLPLDSNSVIIIRKK